MLPTFLPSVRPGFGTSDDLYQLSVGLASGVLASCRQCVVCQCNWWTTVRDVNIHSGVNGTFCVIFEPSTSDWNAASRGYLG
jgi:hypothetical protein